MQKVAVAVIEHRNRFLLGKKVARPGNILSMSWHFPGGKGDDGESIEQTLEREIFEEINVKVSIERLLGKRLTDKFEMYYFLCSLDSIELPSLKACDDLERIQWASAQESKTICPKHVQNEWPVGVSDYLDSKINLN